MASKLFRDRGIKLVQNAVREYSAASGLTHSGLIGKVREIALRDIFEPFLPEGALMGSGKIVDHENTLSAETDLVLYFPRVMPALLYDPSLGVFPIDACIHAFEVKSTSTATTIKDAIEKARTLRTLKYLSGFRNSDGKAISHQVPVVVFAYFAFSTDLSEQGQSELDRYLEYDPAGTTNPLVPVICVVNRGYWYFDQRQHQWRTARPTPEFDEVLGFISGTIDSIPITVINRGLPAFGRYLWSESFIDS